MADLKDVKYPELKETKRREAKTRRRDEEESMQEEDWSWLQPTADPSLVEPSQIAPSSRAKRHRFAEEVADEENQGRWEKKSKSTIETYDTAATVVLILTDTVDGRECTIQQWNISPQAARHSRVLNDLCVSNERRRELKSGGACEHRLATRITLGETSSINEIRAFDVEKVCIWLKKRATENQAPTETDEKITEIIVTQWHMNFFGEGKPEDFFPVLRIAMELDIADLVQLCQVFFALHYVESVSPKGPQALQIPVTLTAAQQAAFGKRVFVALGGTFTG